MGKKKIITVGEEVPEDNKEKRLEQKRDRSKKDRDVKTSDEKEITENIQETIQETDETKKRPKKSAKEIKSKKAKARLRSKKYQEKSHLVNKEKFYTVAEAIGLAKKSSYSSFLGSLEVHITLGIKPDKTEQNIRGLVNLPHKVGKTPTILAFTNNSAEAEKAGAKYAGSDELIAKIEKGFSDFDIVVAEPALMPKIAKIARILGTRGKMPNPKAGTISENLPELIKSVVGGRIEYKNDAYGIVHQNLGKLDADDIKLLENFLAFYKEILQAKPKSVKKDYIKKITLCATMGPGIKIDITDLNEQLKEPKK